MENWGRKTFGPGALFIFLTWHLAESCHYIYSSIGCTVLFTICFAERERNPSQNIFSQNEGFVTSYDQITGRSEVELALWTNGTGDLNAIELSFASPLSHPCSFMCQFQFPRLAKTTKGFQWLVVQTCIFIVSWTKQNKTRLFFPVNTSVKSPVGNHSNQAGWILVPVSWALTMVRLCFIYVSHLYSKVECLLAEEGSEEEGLKGHRP